MRLWLLTLCAWIAVDGAAPGLRAETRALAWDAVEKRYAASAGQVEAEIPFTVTNRSGRPVEIREASTSCRCTEVVFPQRPWTLAPGATDTLRVRVDLRGRRGSLTKTIYVDTSEGEELLRVFLEVPLPPAVQREMNQFVAQGDRQAVLRGDCATCHVAPAAGKKGGDLFGAACLVCHGAAHRASMVPDLMQPTVARDAAYWEKWIREGGEGMMPAWSKAHGGPLDDEQIKSLVEFLVANLPTQPVVK